MRAVYRLQGTCWEELQMHNKRTMNLLDKFGLSVGLAFLLVLRHLLWHGSTNGFLQLLQRLLQSSTLENITEQTEAPNCAPDKIPKFSRMRLCQFWTHATRWGNQSVLEQRTAAHHADSNCALEGNMHGRQGCATNITHLLIQIKLTGTLDQGVLTARQECSQVGVHPRPNLAVQLPGLQFYAEKQDKQTLSRDPAWVP